MGIDPVKCRMTPGPGKYQTGVAPPPVKFYALPGGISVLPDGISVLPGEMSVDTCAPVRI